MNLRNLPFKLIFIIPIFSLLMFGCMNEESLTKINNTKELLDKGLYSGAVKNLKENFIFTPKNEAGLRKINSDFNVIDTQSLDYRNSTTKISIENIDCTEEISSVGDGQLSLSFSSNLISLKVKDCLWGDYLDDLNWGEPNQVENTDKPKILVLPEFNPSPFTISLSTPVQAFGFEMLHAEFGFLDMTVQFYNQDSVLIGQIVKNIGTDVISSNPLVVDSKAGLFAARSSQGIKHVVIISPPLLSGFAITQLRYGNNQSPQYSLELFPSTCNNSLNLTGSGDIQFVLAQQNGNPINSVNLSTLRLNGISPERTFSNDIGKYISKASPCDCEKTIPDGVKDLRLLFNKKQLLNSLSGVNNGDLVTLDLTFTDSQGRNFEVSDCVKVSLMK